MTLDSLELRISPWRNGQSEVECRIKINNSRSTRTRYVITAWSTPEALAKTIEDVFAIAKRNALEIISAHE